MASLYNMLRIICSPLAALVVVLLTTPAGVLAQIPSTTNAAQSSGNNSFGASTSPIGTPTYNTSPESINSLNQAVNETLWLQSTPYLRPSPQALLQTPASSHPFRPSWRPPCSPHPPPIRSLPCKPLQASISAFKAIITQSDSTVLSAHGTNNDVLAIGTVLISARDSYSATP
jgi:hypothetical protein